MIVLGVDPGTRHLGWGVIEVRGTRPVHLSHGVIDTDPDQSIAERLCFIERELGEVVHGARPDQAAVESIFFAKDAMAAAKLGHARGVVLLVLARAKIPIFEYEPARVKRAVCGNGRADKPQIARTMSALLKLATPPRSDAADALGIAFAHAQAAPMAEHLVRIAALEQAARRASGLPVRQTRRPSFVAGGGKGT